jgi:hypothetical protein
LDAFENLCLIWYYWNETKIFFAKSNINMSMSDIVSNSRGSGMSTLDMLNLDQTTNLSWVVGDIAYFFSSLLRLRQHRLELEGINKKLKSIMLQNASSSSSCGSSNGSSTKENAAGGDSCDDDYIDSDSDSNMIAILKEDLQSLEQVTGRMQCKFFISITELLVSGEYSGLWSFLFNGGSRGGRILNNTWVGFFGVCSSVLILREGIIDALNAHHLEQEQEQLSGEDGGEQEQEDEDEEKENFQMMQHGQGGSLLDSASTNTNANTNTNRSLTRSRSRSRSRSASASMIELRGR